MKILLTLSFKFRIKKFHPNQQKHLEESIRIIAAEPAIGVKKKGDLANVFVYKFKIKTQLFLLAYDWNQSEDCITFLDIGSHENFYRDLKKIR